MSAREFRRGGPQPVGDILVRYMRASGLKQKLRSSEVYDCWPDVAGLEACEHSRVVGFNNCVLYVEVDSAPWLQMLATFKKAELLTGIKQLMSGVRVKDIKFKIGGGGAPGPRVSEGNSWQKNPPTTQQTSRSSPA